jgi:hypothetical protein
VEQKDMGVASSARMFSQQIGGSLGVAAFGAVFARKLIESLSSATGTGAHVSTSGGQLNPATVNGLPAAVKHDVFFAIAHATQSVFIWALPAAVAIFVLAWFIKEVPLRGRVAPPEAGETASQQPELCPDAPGRSRTTPMVHRYCSSPGPEPGRRPEPTDGKLTSAQPLSGSCPSRNRRPGRTRPAPAWHAGRPHR